MSIASANRVAQGSALPHPDPAAAIGAQLLTLLPVLRLQSAWIFDHQGKVLWRNEGVLTPNELHPVQTALAILTAADTKAHTRQLFGDGRGAVFLAIRTVQRQLAGMVMLLMDARTLGSGNLAARILTSAIRDLLQQAALALDPSPVSELPLFSTGEGADEEWVLRVLESRPASDSIETDPEPKPAGAREETSPGDPQPARAAPATAHATLLLQEFVRLRAGSDSRCFKVSPEDERQRGNAAETLERLLAWVRANPAVLQGAPLSFTLGVSGSALKDEQLPAKLAALLDGAPLKPDQIGFEIRERACVVLRPQVERLLAWCERTGCFAVIDDFSFESAGLDQLRSGAVKLLKIDVRLGSEVLRDRLAQARVVAIVQAAKVLGMHCVAKYVDSRSGRNWLAAAGFGFTQSMTTSSLRQLLP